MWMNLRYPHLLMGPFSINISFCLYRYFVIISGGGDAGRADQRFLLSVSQRVMRITQLNRRLWSELRRYVNLFEPLTLILDEWKHESVLRRSKEFYGARGGS